MRRRHKAAFILALLPCGFPPRRAYPALELPSLLVQDTHLWSLRIGSVWHRYRRIFHRFWSLFPSRQVGSGMSYQWKV